MDTFMPTSTAASGSSSVPMTLKELTATTGKLSMAGTVAVTSSGMDTVRLPSTHRRLATMAVGAEDTRPSTTVALFMNVRMKRENSTAVASMASSALTCSVTLSSGRSSSPSRTAAPASAPSPHPPPSPHHTNGDPTRRSGVSWRLARAPCTTAPAICPDAAPLPSSAEP